MLTFDNPGKEAFWNIVGKGEHVENQHFLHFPRCFLPYQNILHHFKHVQIVLSNSFNLDYSNILSFGIEVKPPFAMNEFPPYFSNWNLWI